MNGKSLIVGIIGLIFLSLTISFGVSILFVWLGSLFFHCKFSWGNVILIWIMLGFLYGIIKY